MIISLYIVDMSHIVSSNSIRFLVKTGCGIFLMKCILKKEI